MFSLFYLSFFFVPFSFIHTTVQINFVLFFSWGFIQSSDLDDKVSKFVQLSLVVHDDKNKISLSDSKLPLRLAFLTKPTIWVS